MPFLLIHGLGQTSEAWEETRRLLPFGDVHCPDLVHLLDGAPAAYETLYRAFAAYCDALPQPLHLCGLSLGGMLALPHIRVNDINHPYVIIGVCENPIEDYQGQDDQPVRVIVFTVAPDENQEAYLQLLSSISRRLRNPALIEELIANVSAPAQILDIIKREDA